MQVGILEVDTADHQHIQWMHLTGASNQELLRVLEQRDIQLVLPSVSQRASFDRYSDFYYVRFYAFPSDGHSSRVQPAAVHMVVQPTAILTWSGQATQDTFQQLRNKMDRHRNLIDNVHSLCYALLDQIVEDTFWMFDRLNDRLASVEHEVFQKSIPGDIQPRIFRLKREILGLRHILASERDVSYQLVRFWDTIFTKGTQSTASTLWSFELYDHVIRLFDSADTYRELINSALDIYLSNVSNRLNEIVKKLTIMTVLFVPASLVAALYGMNFDFLPGQHHPWGFYFVIGGVGIASIALVWIFRSRRWL